MKGYSRVYIINGVRTSSLEREREASTGSLRETATRVKQVPGSLRETVLKTADIGIPAVGRTATAAPLVRRIR